MRSAWFVLALVVAAPAAADEPGYLLLHHHAEIDDRDGAQGAELFVYSEDGAIVHSGRSGGQFAAGEYVELQPGTYFVEVGRFRAPANAVRMQVDAGRVTVVPSGWISVSTPPLSAQPTEGCAQWNAELNAFAGLDAGAGTLINTNRGSGVRTWGAIQLLAGEATVFFNDVPTTVSVVADEVNELPTGFQDPVYGVRPQLSTRPDGDPAGLRVPLCADGPIQVPAGVYWASGAVAIDIYPYERRDWNQVTVAVDEEPDHAALRAPRLEHPRYDGPGSDPEPLTDEERTRIAGGDGGGVRLMGFD